MLRVSMEFFIVQFRFSIHEMAVFDLPAALKKVISISGGKSVAYVGHSMGTTTFLAMCSSKIPVSDKVDLAILLAPVVDPRGIKSNVLQGLSKVHQAYWTVLETAGVLEILPDCRMMDVMTKWTLSQLLMAIR